MIALKLLPACERLRRPVVDCAGAWPNADMKEKIVRNARRLITSIIALSLLGGATAVQADDPKGYLEAGELDVTSVLEPAPRRGDPRYETDRKIFRATRKLVDTPRWRLATNDIGTSVPAMLHNYSCAVGVTLTTENAPKLVSLLRRAGIDTNRRTTIAKEFYRRDRPFIMDRGPTCQRPAALYDTRNKRMSYDYPSGHTTWGWTWGLILTSVVPDRAQNILERARAYGDSRLVCGAHNESAVEAGMLSASATMALVQTKAAYQADLAAARAEMDALRNTGARPAGCEAETALVRQRVIPRLDLP